ncbi:MAG: hypothetical protein JW984_08120 [Deltaproteobacteria bacterium]|uniref:Transmembrane protein n=1 Tax=Candidatus Zymogenus saltonus TaxID=2844893 RepID=A0A9D8KG36_9DELT|nr:hypothetical protein [Candidatus Zymogenus saltonus]
MKKWIKQIREGRDKGGRDRVGGDDILDDNAKDENIATLYEVVEDYLKSLDHNQLMEVTDEFLDRYERHADEIARIIKVRPKGKVLDRRGEVERETGVSNKGSEISGGASEGERRGRVMGDDNMKYFLREWMDVIREQDNRRFETKLKHLAEKSSAETRRLEDILALKVKRIESDVSTAADHQMGLVAMLQNEIHEQNRRLFTVFNRVWILITGLVVAFLLGGAALLVALLK